jgi:solute carrier family 45 protein 1/2/4
MNVFAWAREIATVSWEPRALQHGDARQILAIAIAVLSFLVLNTSLQPVQMGLRALAADSITFQQQGLANTWTSCWVGIGNIVGHVAGSMEAKASTIIGRYQFLTLIASLCLVLTTTLCCIFVRETTRLEYGPGTSMKRSPTLARQLIETYHSTDSRIKTVCRIQFCAWMTWFPLLFYGSTQVPLRLALKLEIRLKLSVN